MPADEASGFACTGCASVQMHPTRARSAFWLDERLVVVEGIPALVCGQCGEQFFDDVTTVRLDLLRGSGFPPAEARRTMEVTVFDYGASPDPAIAP